MELKQYWCFTILALVFLGSFAYTYYTITESGSEGCSCADAEEVDVTVTPCGLLIKKHTYGACWKTTGRTSECSGETWQEIVYRATQTAWVKASDVTAETQTSCSGSGGSCGNVDFVSRAKWGARAPKTVTPQNPPMSMVFVHHTAMDPCFTPESCVLMARQIQDLHMDDRGWDDVGYSFLVGQDGRVYEGRGWEHVPAQVKGYNERSYGVVIMGNFMETTPVEKSQQAVRDIIDCGIQQGYVTVGHEEFGHRDGGCTLCPGDLFYPILRTWPSYSLREIPHICFSEKTVQTAGTEQQHQLLK